MTESTTPFLAVALQDVVDIDTYKAEMLLTYVSETGPSPEHEESASKNAEQL